MECVQQLELPLWPQACLRRVLADFLATETDGLAPATLDDYRVRASWLCSVLGDGRDVSTITYGTIRDLIARYGPTSQHGFLCCTLKKRFVFLRAVLRHAHAMGWSTRPPPELPRMQDDGERRQALLTCEQWPRFEGQLCPGQMRRAGQLAWWTGMHRLDLMAARLRWFEPEHEWANGFRGRWLRHNHKAPRIAPCWLPMEPGLRACAQTWHAECGPSLEAFVCGKTWNLSRNFHAACTRAELPKVSPIDLRRSAASRLIGAGHDDQYVRLWLGHVGTVGADARARRPTTLDKHYACVTPEMLSRAASIF
jgi:integrase